MREMDVKSRGSSGNSYDGGCGCSAESRRRRGAHALANNAETLFASAARDRRAEGARRGYPVRSGSTAHASRASPPNGARWPTAQRNSAAGGGKRLAAWTENRTSVSPPCSRMRVSSPVRSPRSRTHRDHAFLRKTARRWKSALCRQRKSSPPRSGRTQEASARLTEEKKRLNEIKEKEQSLANVISGSMLMAGREQKRQRPPNGRQSSPWSCAPAIRAFTSFRNWKRSWRASARPRRSSCRSRSAARCAVCTGRSAKMIRTEDRYDRHRNGARRGDVGNIVVENEDAARRIYSALLKRRDGGRVTLQPMDVIRPARLNGEPVSRGRRATSACAPILWKLR